MRRLESMLKAPRLPLFIIGVLTVYQLIRVIAFANVYGGLEHDSGWFLGVSRSLAEQGTYTSMVSTLVNPAVLGDIDVDQKFNIQAPDGRIWFFTGNGTGPASIVPNALILKLFGTGFWSLRAGPLLFYVLLLLAAAYLLYTLAGLGAVVLFHLFIFFYPRLTIFLAYEAEGEVAAMAYVLSACLALYLAARQRPPRRRYFLLAGLIAGLAINTKLLALLAVSGIGLWLAYNWLAKRGEVRLREVLAWAAGLLLVPGLWELVHLVVLVRLAGPELYLRHSQYRLRFVLDDGSGMGQRSHTGLEFIWRKFLMLEEVAQARSWVVIVMALVILLGGLALWWYWRRQPGRLDLVAPLWLGWLVNTAWFVGLAKTGWPRHFWFGLILAVLLCCVIPVWLLQRARQAHDNGPGRWGVLATGGLLLVWLGWNFASQPHVLGFFIPDDIVPYWLEQRFNYVDMSGLPWILVPRAEQAEVVDYIRQMPPEAKVYYPTAEFGHKAAEIPVLTGRINYPFYRRGQPGMTPHPADILLVPPSILSIWRYAPQTRQELRQMVAQACPRPVLENNNYIICLADDVHLPDTAR